ncbi:hypothetical protein [Streptomyces odontomachi]|uniref:hypothetical protein n=1 Tax=Streptomyces odontomachi TaxID=2944940 RepID=UPI0021093C7F|nr:hypothetical protein [Streptomyces sp. ODS25]
MTEGRGRTGAGTGAGRTAVPAARVARAARAARPATTAPSGTGSSGTGSSGTGPSGTGPSGTERQTFRVDIGELVLTGFDRALDTTRVTAAFEAELARLVRERGVPLAADGAGRALDALGGLPPLPAHLSARRLGQELARAVHDGLSGRGEAL